MRAVALALCLCFASESLASEPVPVVTVADTSEDRVGRLLAELGGAAAGAALPTLLWLPFLLNQNQGGSGSLLFPAMFAVAMSLEPLSMATGAWLVHKKLGGRGLWPAAFGGTMLGVALGAGVVGSVVYATNGNTLYTALSALGGGLVGLAAAVFVLELHHDRNTDVSASVVPTPGGVVGGINLRF